MLSMLEAMPRFLPVEALAGGFAVNLWRNPNPQRHVIGRVGLIFLALRRLTLVALNTKTISKDRPWTRLAIQLVQKFAELGTLDFLVMAFSRFYPNVLAIPETWSGKDPETGKFRPLMYLLWFPFYFVEHSMFRRIVRQILSKPKPFLDKYNLIDSTDGRNVYVGMWPSFFDCELPPHIGMVLDLSNDWEESNIVLRGREYVCCPVWDQTIPLNKERFVRAVLAAADFDGNLYIHCGFGVGRSVQAAVAVLVRRGIVSGWEEGFKKVKAARPFVELRPEAQAFLAEIVPRLQAREERNEVESEA